MSIALAGTCVADPKMLEKAISESNKEQSVYLTQIIGLLKEQNVLLAELIDKR